MSDQNSIDSSVRRSSMDSFTGRSSVEMLPPVLLNKTSLTIGVQESFGVVEQNSNAAEQHWNPTEPLLPNETILDVPYPFSASGGNQKWHAGDEYRVNDLIFPDSEKGDHVHNRENIRMHREMHREGDHQLFGIFSMLFGSSKKKMKVAEKKKAEEVRKSAAKFEKKTKGGDTSRNVSTCSPRPDEGIPEINLGEAFNFTMKSTKGLGKSKGGGAGSSSRTPKGGGGELSDFEVMAAVANLTAEEKIAYGAFHFGTFPEYLFIDEHDYYWRWLDDEQRWDGWEPSEILPIAVRKCIEMQMMSVANEGQGGLCGVNTPYGDGARTPYGVSGEDGGPDPYYGGDAPQFGVDPLPQLDAPQFGNSPSGARSNLGKSNLSATQLMNATHGLNATLGGKKKGDKPQFAPKKGSNDSKEATLKLLRTFGTMGGGKRMPKSLIGAGGHGGHGPPAVPQLSVDESSSSNEAAIDNKLKTKKDELNEVQKLIADAKREMQGLLASQREMMLEMQNQMQIQRQNQMQGQERRASSGSKRKTKKGGGGRTPRGGPRTPRSGSRSPRPDSTPRGERKKFPNRLQVPGGNRARPGRPHSRQHTPRGGSSGAEERLSPIRKEPRKKVDYTRGALSMAGYGQNIAPVNEMAPKKKTKKPNKWKINLVSDADSAGSPTGGGSPAGAGSHAGSPSAVPKFGAATKKTIIMHKASAMVKKTNKFNRLVSDRHMLPSGDEKNFSSATSGDEEGEKGERGSVVAGNVSGKARTPSPKRTNIREGAAAKVERDYKKLKTFEEPSAEALAGKDSNEITPLEFVASDAKALRRGLTIMAKDRKIEALKRQGDVLKVADKQHNILPVQVVYDAEMQRQIKELTSAVDNLFLKTTKIIKPNIQLIKDITDRVLDIEIKFKKLEDPLGKTYDRVVRRGQSIQQAAADLRFVVEGQASRDKELDALIHDFETGGPVERAIIKLNLPARVAEVEVHGVKIVQEISDLKKKIVEFRKDLKEQRELRQKQDKVRREEAPIVHKNLQQWQHEAKPILNNIKEDHVAMFRNNRNFSSLLQDLQERVKMFEHDRNAQWMLQGEMVSRYTPIAAAVSGLMGAEDVVSDVQKLNKIIAIENTKDTNADIDSFKSRKSNMMMLANT